MVGHHGSELACAFASNVRPILNTFAPGWLNPPTGHGLRHWLDIGVLVSSNAA